MVNGSSSEISSFALGMLVIKNPDGSNTCELDFLNNKTPIEVVIMQLETFLKEQKDKYFESYTNDLEKED